MQQDQWETDAASFGYVTDFPALIDPEQRQKSVEPDLPARNQTAKSKKSMTASVGSATNLPALIDLEQRQKSVEPELPARNQTAKPKKKINKQSSTQSRSVPSPNQSNEAPPPPPINGESAQGPAMTNNQVNGPSKINVFINKDYEGDLFEINCEFLTKYEPVGFLCETTRNGIKASLSSNEDLCNFEKILQEKSVPYSIQLPRNKVDKYVIKGLHPRTNTEQILKVLQNNHYKVEKVANMTSFKTKKPLPMFIIEMTKTSDNNARILGVRNLVGFKFSVELFRKTRVPPQCSNCQMYFHTAGNCRAPARCRVCAGSHHTSSSAENMTRKCCHCSLEHTANYKGCQVYKDLCKKKKATKKNEKLPQPRNPPSAQGVSVNEPQKRRIKMKSQYTQVDPLPNVENTGTLKPIQKASKNVRLQTDEICTCGFNCPAYNNASVIHDLDEIMCSVEPDVMKSIAHMIKKLHNKHVKKRAENSDPTLQLA